MAIDRESALMDITGTFVHNKFKEQSWYQANANTITTLGGLLATVLAWVVTQPFAVDPRVQMGVLILGFILTVFGVKKTPNGFSKSQVAKIDEHRAEVIGSTPLISPVYLGSDTTEIVNTEPVDYDREIAEYNAQRVGD